MYFFFQSLSLYNVIQVREFKYGSYSYPHWAKVVAILLSFSSVGLIPIYAMYQIAQVLKGRKRWIEVCSNCSYVMRLKHYSWSCVFVNVWDQYTFLNTSLILFRLFDPRMVNLCLYIDVAVAKCFGVQSIVCPNFPEKHLCDKRSSNKFSAVVGTFFSSIMLPYTRKYKIWYLKTLENLVFEVW